MSITQEIIARAEELQEKMVQWRRDFHTYAEMGWCEMRTTSLIGRHLKDLGYEVLMGEAVCNRESRLGVPEEAVLEREYRRAAEQGGDPELLEETRGGMTGVVGILRCGEGATVALRFDIDALGVVEAQEADHFPAAEGFVSVNHGVMHACGHDGHAAIGMAVAELLMELRESLHGTVKIIFQPAEEGVRGAKAIVEKGHLDGVDVVLGCHISDDKGREGVTVVPASHGSFATAKYDVVFHGVSAHAGGAPQEGNNAMLAVATAVLNLQAIPRHGGGASRVNVGRLVAGSGRNVICDEARMELEVRGATTEVNEYMAEYALRIIESAAAMHGCTAQWTPVGGAEAMECDAALIQRLRGVWEAVGIAVSREDSMVLEGSEDFAYMANRVQQQGGQATFFRALTPCAAGAHNRAFDFDESVLQKAAALFALAVVDLMQQNN